MDKEFYTIEEVMAILQLSRQTVYRYVRSGKLPAYKIGKWYRVKVSDFDSFIKESKVSFK